MFAHRATVHERLCAHGEARFHNTSLVDVKHKVWVLHNIDPEPQWQAEKAQIIIITIIMINTKTLLLILIVLTALWHFDGYIPHFLFKVSTYMWFCHNPKCDREDKSN